MTENDFIWRFTPSRTDPEVLESIFVQRENLLTSILDRVSESATTDNKHHLLLIGQRGIGKTHLISLLNYRIQQKAELAKQLRIAWFLEDETITSFVQLLKRIYQLLSEEYPAEFPIEWLNDLLDESSEQIEKALEAELVQCFDNQTLLLFIENLDYVFDGLSKEGQQKWRSFLQEHPFTCIVATSQRLFSGIKKREQPFFGFFTPIHLKPLQVSNAVDLLRHIAEQRVQPDLEQYLRTPEGRSRVRALHHLAGGNHRIYIVLSGFITRDSLDELTQPFEKMADELTPYYQERMRWLSPQQRQIVEFLCTQTAPCTPKKMARQLLAGETSISSQLKKLLEYGYVMKSPRGRESLYELTEPLMRLASEVKDKRRKPLRLLVDFLRIWYSPEHLTGLMKTAGSDGLRTHVSAALDRSIESPDPRLAAIREDIERARKDGRLHDLMQVLEEQVHLNPTADTWFDLGFSQTELQQYELAFESFNRASELDPEDAITWYNKGRALFDLGRYEDSLQCYDRASDLGPENVDTLNAKGLSLLELDRIEESLESFDRACELAPEDADAWNNKGCSLHELGRFEDSLECFDRALGLDSKFVHSWNNKGWSLSKLGRFEESLVCYDRALELAPEYVPAWNNKSWSLSNVGRFEESLVCLDRALELDPADMWTPFNRVEALFALHRWTAGFEGLRQAFIQCPAESEHDVMFLVHLIEGGSAGSEERSKHVQTLVEIYEEGQSLPHLGDGLVRSLGKLDADRLSEKALAEWRDIWLEAASEHVEMEIPLRIFSVGIEYLIKKDERVLLDLIATERRILQQALGLESTADSEN
ncbi:MAG: tetratricopeptide (TPR) repeat protein [Porticoccaceae bacterium]|jgi:tetratricopeptide (TPR) repeat protein